MLWAMQVAICPSCGSALDVISKGSGPRLSCASCGWTSGGTCKSETSAPPAFLQLLPSLGEGQDLFANLLNSLKPRPLVADWRIKIALVVVAVSAASVIATVADYANHPDVQATTLFLVLVLWIAAMASLQLLPELPRRRLIREGEISIGRIVYQQTVLQGRTNRSFILYAFSDKLNRGWIGQGIDYSDSLAERAPVAIFYDPTAPEKNVAAECARFRVKAD